MTWTKRVSTSSRKCIRVREGKRNPLRPKKLVYDAMRLIDDEIGEFHTDWWAEGQSYFDVWEGNDEDGMATIRFTDWLLAVTSPVIKLAYSITKEGNSFPW